MQYHYHSNKRSRTIPRQIAAILILSLFFATALPMLSSGGTSAGFPAFGGTPAGFPAFDADTSVYAADAKPATTTITVKSKDNTTTAWISQTSPLTNILSRDSIDTLTVSRSKSGRRDIALVRLPLPANVTASEVKSAYLYLKKSSGSTPSVKADIIKSPWIYNDVNWKNFKNNTAGKTSPSSQYVGNGWYRINVTTAVKKWFAGSYANAGLAIAETKKGKSTAFYSGYGDDPKKYPKLKITYAKQTPETQYGKFGFTKVKNTNCLSFALRDRNPIFYDALFPDTKAFQAAYDEGGTAGGLQYTKEAVIAYVDAHRAELKISNLRVLKSWKSPIDPAKEYRVAMRVGFHDRNIEAGVQVDEDFDYHFMAQLSDGAWAQAIGNDPSALVPGSNRDLNPCKYPWDGSSIWGFEKWAGYYDSAAVYFAVTKDAKGFTSHQEK
jgi:hypothetical protein